MLVKIADVQWQEQNGGVLFQFTSPTKNELDEPGGVVQALNQAHIIGKICVINWVLGTHSSYSNMDSFLSSNPWYLNTTSHIAMLCL